MAKVVWSAGIDHVSGVLCKSGKKGQHSCEKMLLGTHRVAATESKDCNRLYLRRKVERSTPLSNREVAVRARFTAVRAAVATRAADLSKQLADQQAFMAQKDQPGGKKTLKAYYWMVCGAEYDQQHS